MPPWIRWIITALVLVCVSLLCFIAGRWQYGRHVERSEALSSYNERHDIPAIDIDGIATDLANGAGEYEWRSVLVQGEILPDSLTWLRNRPVDSQAAVHALVWVQTPTTTVLVNLGYTSPDLRPQDFPQKVSFEGVVRKLEHGKEPSGTGATSIDPAHLPSPAQTPLGVYLVRSETCQVTSPCTEFPVQATPLPSLSLGPHLSYALQWWLFAVAIPVVVVVVIRRQARLDAEAEEAALKEPGKEHLTQTTSPSPRPTNTRARREPRRRKEQSDEEVEDAL